MRVFDELIVALTLLTRLPVSRLIGQRAWPDEARAVWAYPLVGALIGCMGGAMLRLAMQRLPPTLASLLAIACMILLTGGLHEDGLADTMDGFGGGNTVQRKLDIMRDSRIGSYGVLALILLVAVRTAALSATVSGLGARAGLALLVATGGLSRGAMVLVLMLLPPARFDGTAAGLRQVRRPQAALALLLATASTALLPIDAAIACCLTALAVGAGLAAIAHRQVQGYTGDILGAVACLADCAVLCAAVGTTL
jgi:adenosylcobinamide-GDP ribazoletransferase